MTGKLTAYAVALLLAAYAFLIESSWIDVTEHRLDPNLIVLAGDIVDSPGDLDGALRVFLRRLPGAGTFANLGNWEDWSSVPLNGLRSIYEEAGVLLLGNEFTHADGVQIAGSDDSTQVPPTPPGSGGYVGGWHGCRPGLRMYVSWGLGSSVLVFRLGARTEIAVLH